MEQQYENKPAVLVTAIGTAAATTVVCELRKTGQYYIIGADINSKVEIATSREVDEFYVFPSSVCELEKYIEFVISFCIKKRVQYYYAIIDEEVANLAAHKSRFDDIGVKLCLANPELIRICHHKNLFFEWIRENIPEVYIQSFHRLQDIEESDFPLFVKPTEGRASNGCIRVNTMEQLRELCDGNCIPADVLVQKYIEGNVIAVDLVRNAVTNQSAQLQRKENLRNESGCGIAVEIIRDERLSEICERIMRKMNLHGVVNAEFFEINGTFRIIEINPRLSAGTSFSCQAGLNTVLNAIEIADGRCCKFGEISVGKHFVKRYETYETDL